MNTSENMAALAAKVRALMAKTVEAGATEDEAMAAASKARELMDKYNLTLTTAEIKEEGVVKDRVNYPTGRIDATALKFFWQSVERFTETKSWLSQGQFTGEKTIVFLGSKPDVEFAKWLLESLLTFIRNGADEAKRRHGHDKRSFTIGCASRIGERLRALIEERKRHMAQAPATGTALVTVTKQQMIAAYVAQAGLRFATSRSNVSGSRDGNAAAAGRAHGDRAGFGRPVSGSAGTLRIGR